MNSFVNRRLAVVSAVVLIAAGSAFLSPAMAGESEGSLPSQPSAAAPNSRAQVREETRQALRSGQVQAAFLASYDVHLDPRRPAPDTAASRR